MASISAKTLGAQENLRNCGQALFTIGVIISVLDSQEELYRCLQSLRATGFPFAKIVVVDDGSDEPIIINDLDVTLIRLLPSQGPATARNIGAASCSTDLLLFIDADVQVDIKLPYKICDAFIEIDSLDACVGAYDWRPVNESAVSLFRNLFHAHTHEISEGPVETFWSACGVVKRPLFEQVKGFSAAFRCPSIEDVELGWRMTRAGAKIYLLPALRVKHQKIWTFPSMVHTDIFRRARPWARLNYQKKLPRACLARRFSQQVCGGLVFGGTCASIVLAFCGAFEQAMIVWGLSLTVGAVGNAKFLRSYLKHPASNLGAVCFLLQAFYLCAVIGTMIGIVDGLVAEVNGRQLIRRETADAKTI
jgi:GT2 family glycosyltransferase